MDLSYSPDELGIGRSNGAAALPARPVQSVRTDAAAQRPDWSSFGVISGALSRKCVARPPAWFAGLPA